MAEPLSDDDLDRWCALMNFGVLELEEAEERQRLSRRLYDDYIVRGRRVAELERELMRVGGECHLAHEATAMMQERAARLERELADTRALARGREVAHERDMEAIDAKGGRRHADE